MSEIKGRLVIHQTVGDRSSRVQKYVFSDSASFFSGLTLKQKREVVDKFNNYDRLVEENQCLTADRENAINLMSPSWQHAASKEPDLMKRYVTMAENQFKKKNTEIERLTAIATKHATRADELYEALEKIMPAVKQYLEYEHDGDPWTEDARSMGEMDLNELDNEGVIEEIFSILDKSRIEAEGD